jgi:integrase/recombinase XerD
MPKNLYLREGIYWARFKVGGIEYRQSLRTRSERVAEKRMKALRESIEDEAVYGIDGPVTWPDAVVGWNEGMGDRVAARTFQRYAESLRGIRSHFDHLDIQHVTVDVLKELIKLRRKGGVKNSTIRRDLTAISSVLEHAVDEGWIAENPATMLNRKRLVPEKTVPIILPQVESMAQVFPKLPRRTIDVCELTREIGLRIDEATGLTHPQIDRAAMVATFRGKGNRVRAVTLTPRALEIIDRQPRFIGKPWVFWRDDGQRIMALSNRITYAVQKAAQKAAQAGREFHSFSHHSFRHMFAVEYLRFGRGSIYDLQREMGHGSITTTERYLAFLTPEEAKRAMHGVAQNGAQEQRFAGGEG